MIHISMAAIIIDNILKSFSQTPSINYINLILWACTAFVILAISSSREWGFDAKTNSPIGKKNSWMKWTLWQKQLIHMEGVIHKPPPGLVYFSFFLSATYWFFCFGCILFLQWVANILTAVIDLNFLDNNRTKLFCSLPVGGHSVSAYEKKSGK